MNNNEQRDELARELFIADNSNQPREASIVDWEWFESTDNYRGRIEHYKNMAAGMIAAGYRKSNLAVALREIANSPEVLERARKRIEDELVEWRNSGLSMLGRRNGLVIFNRDSTPSNIIRFGFEDAFRIALKAEADRMEAEATP